MSDVSSNTHFVQDYKQVDDIGYRKALAFRPGYVLPSWLDTRLGTDEGDFFTDRGVFVPTTATPTGSPVSGTATPTPDSTATPSATSPAISTASSTRTNTPVPTATGAPTGSTTANRHVHGNFYPHRNYSTQPDCSNCDSYFLGNAHRTGHRYKYRHDHGHAHTLSKRNSSCQRDSRFHSY